MKTGSPLKLVSLLSLAAIGGAAALTSCGGDAPPITIAGTAATGAAISNASVSAVCKQGAGTAITGRDGAYILHIDATGEGPCVITATHGSTVLRSIAAGEGRANITPLTDVLVSFIAVQSGASASATPSVLANNQNVATVVGTPTVMKVSVQEMSNVVNAAAGTGVQVPTDFLTGVLVPKDASNAGNAQDQVLEILKDRGVITAAGTVAPAVVDAALQRAAALAVTGGQSGGTGGG